MRAAFLEGLRDSDSATISMHGYSCFACDSQLAAMTLMMLTEALGYTTSITPNHGVVLTRAPVWRHAHAVKKVTRLPPSEQYVYDLTTASHHFQAGPGHLVVHNTDSVMVDFKASLADSFKLGEEAAERITGIFKAPIMLEFEKVFSPYLLFSKKRYCGLMYASSPETPDKLDAKGISLVRRDSCGLVKRVSKQALDLIMYKADPAGAIEVVRQAAQQLMDGQVPMAELQMSKSLRASYTNMQPHDVVRNKIASRSPGEEPRAGDRVEFVYVEDPDCASRNVTVRAEDPQWAAAHNMRDFAHYFSLLKSALSDIVSVLGYDVDDVFMGVGEAAYRAARQQRELHYKNGREGQLEITQFFAGAGARRM